MFVVFAALAAAAAAGALHRGRPRRGADERRSRGAGGEDDGRRRACTPSQPSRRPTGPARLVRAVPPGPPHPGAGVDRRHAQRARRAHGLPALPLAGGRRLAPDAGVAGPGRRHGVSRRFFPGSARRSDQLAALRSTVDGEPPLFRARPGLRRLSPAGRHRRPRATRVDAGARGGARAPRELFHAGPRREVVFPADPVSARVACVRRRPDRPRWRRDRRGCRGSGSRSRRCARCASPRARSSRCATPARSRSASRPTWCSPAIACYVLDDLNGRVAVLDLQGRSLGTIPLPGPEGTSWLGIGFGGADQLFLASSGDGRIVVMDLKGRHGARVPHRRRRGGREPRGDPGLARESASSRTTAPTRVRVFSLDGKQQASWGGLGESAAQFRAPFRVVQDSLDRVLVTDALNSRVLAFTPKGEPLGGFRGVRHDRGDPLPSRRACGSRARPGARVGRLFRVAAGVQFPGRLPGGAVRRGAPAGARESDGAGCPRPHRVRRRDGRRAGERLGNRRPGGERKSDGERDR